MSDYRKIIFHTHKHACLKWGWLKKSIYNKLWNICTENLCVWYCQTTTTEHSFKIAICVMAWKYWTDISGKSMSVCEKVLQCYLLHCRVYFILCWIFPFSCWVPIKPAENSVSVHMYLPKIYSQPFFPFSISFLMYARYGISLEKRV